LKADFECEMCVGGFEERDEKQERETEKSTSQSLL
jgi:hypothetical protein